MSSRTRTATALAAAALLTVLLAGCSSQSPPTADATIDLSSDPPAPSPTAAPGNGMVTGIVGDDAVYPLKGVEVIVVGLGLNGTTDSNGRFSISDVPPGIYLLEGRKKDHATTQTTVEVASEKVAHAVLLLPRIPPTDPYHSTFSQDESIFLGSLGFEVIGGTGGLDIHLDPASRSTIVVESVWKGSIVDTDGTPLQYSIDNPDRTNVVTAGAPNPFSVRIDPRILPPGKSDFSFDVGPGDGAVVADAKGQSFLTVFYNAPAPEGWSILRGDT